MLPQCAFPLAPPSKVKEAVRAARAAEEREAKEFIAATPLLAKWVNQNPLIVRRCGHAVWKVIYQTAGPENSAQVFSDLSELGKRNLIKNAADARMLAQALPCLRPIYGEELVDFLRISYPRYKESFRRSLESNWPGILDLFVAVAGKFGPFARGNVRIVSGMLPLLRDGWGRQFKILLPYLKEAADAQGPNFSSLCHGLMKFRSGARLSYDDQVRDMGIFLVRHKKDNGTWLNHFLNDTLPEIKRVSGRSWTKDWPRVLEFINSLDKEDFQLLLIPISQLHWPFKNLEEIRQAAAELKAIAADYGPSDAPAVWYFQKRYGHFAKTPADISDLMDRLRAVSRDMEGKERFVPLGKGGAVRFSTKTAMFMPLGHQANYRALSLLKHVRMENVDDFQLGLETSADLLTKYDWADIVSLQEQLLFQDTLDPVDFLMLYPVLMERNLPLTPEFIREWGAVRESAGTIDWIKIHRGGRVGEIRRHYRASLRKLLARYPKERCDKIYVPARVHFQSTEQARRFVQILKRKKSHDFIALGRVIGPDQEVLAAAPKLNAQHVKRYERLFGTTDNLFLVPVRNTLAYSFETFHNRSFEPVHSKKVSKERVLVGKGGGIPEGKRKRGVVASYDRGAGVHRFYGGFDVEEKTAVADAEQQMKSAFERATQNPTWRALADIFAIREDNLFLNSVAEFRPLALPAYLTSRGAKAKFKGKTVRLPSHSPPFGIRLIRTQPLLRHMGIGKIDAHRKVMNTATVQRIFYYQTPTKKRLSELPVLNDVAASMGVYPKVLEVMGITVRSKGEGKNRTVEFITLGERPLPDRLVRAYLFMGFVVRTALLAHILHHDLGASGSNKWGSIFSSINLNPFTIFDYDTIVLPGDPRFKPRDIRRFQAADKSYLLIGGNASIPLFYHLLGEFEGPWDVTAAWLALYDGRFEDFFRMTGATSAEMAQLLQSAQAPRAQPFRWDSPDLEANLLAPHTQIATLEEILAALRGDTHYEDLVRLAEAKIIKTPLDIQLLRIGLAELRPVFKEHTVTFLENYYPFFKKTLRRDLEFCWPGVLELMKQAATAKHWEGFNPLQVVAGTIRDLKKSFGRGFRGYWPYLVRVGKAAKGDIGLMFPSLEMLKSPLELKPGQQLDGVVEVLERLSPWQMERFLDHLLPQIIRLSGIAWDSNWPRVKETLDKIGPHTMDLIMIPLVQWEWQFYSLQDLEETIEELYSATSGADTNNVAVLWYLETQLPHIARNAAQVKELQGYVLGPGRERFKNLPRGMVPRDWEATAIISLLSKRNVALRNMKDFKLAVTAARETLSHHNIGDIARYEERHPLAGHAMDAVTFATLYPVLVERDMPRSLEHLQQWKKACRNVAPLNLAGVEDQALLKTVQTHYRGAVRQFVRTVSHKDFSPQELEIESMLVGAGTAVDTSQEESARKAMESLPDLMEWARYHPDLVSQMGFSTWLDIYKSVPPGDAMLLLGCVSRLSALEVLNKDSNPEDAQMLAHALAMLVPMFGTRVVSLLAGSYDRLKEVCEPNFRLCFPEIVELLMMGSWENALALTEAIARHEGHLSTETIHLIRSKYPRLFRIFGSNLKEQWGSVINLFDSHPKDAALLMKGIAKLSPVYREQTVSFVAECFPGLKETFGAQLPAEWPAILDLLVAAAGPETKRNPENAKNVAAGIPQLKDAFKNKFLTFWPAVVQMGLEAKSHSWSVLRRLPSLQSGYRLDSPGQLVDVARVLVGLNGEEDKITVFTNHLLPHIRAIAKKEWKEDWPRVKSFLEKLSSETVFMLGIIIGQWQCRFRNLEDLEKTISDLHEIRKGYCTPNEAPAIWYIQTQWDHLFAGKEQLQEMWKLLRGDRLDSEALHCIIAMLRDVKMKDRNDFQLAVGCARNLVETYGSEVIAETQGKLLLEGSLDVVDFAVLYPMMLEQRIAITREVIDEWKELRAGLPQFQLPRELPGTPVLFAQVVYEHFAPAVEEMGKRYPGKAPDMIHCPARLCVQTKDQANRIAKFLTGNDQRAFIRIGRLVAPDGTVLLEETPLASKYHGLFGSTDNLFLVPVRNPLAYRETTWHQRSYRVPDSLYERKPDHELVGKGVGCPFYTTRRGVCASFTKGIGVHSFFGGLDDEEKAAVEDSEISMKKYFRRMMKRQKWRDLADFFHITEDNLFITGVAEFQPLALPAYLKTQRARLKFKGQTVNLPDQDLPFGLSLVKTQPLLEHMGVGTIAAHGGVKKTSEVQRIYYYLTPEMTRIGEMPARETFKDQYKEPYSYVPFLHHLGIEAYPRGPGADTPFVFKDAAGQELSERTVRQYVYVGLLVRTAIVARILHHDMHAAGKNKWGSIFYPLNTNPLSVFDYGTINLKGDPRFTEQEFAEFQKNDEDSLIGKDGLLAQFAKMMKEETMFAKSWKENRDYGVTVLWQLIYLGELKTLKSLGDPLVRSRLISEEIGQRLAEFLDASRRQRAKPRDPSNHEQDLLQGAA